MVHTPSKPETTQWIAVCPFADIVPNTGVCALIEGQQVAIFRVSNSDRAYAIGNYDPFSKTFVLSRGIVGDRQGVLKVASPIYKQNFNLSTGECLDDPNVSVPSYPTRIVDGIVEVGIVSNK